MTTNDVHCGVDDNIGYAGLALYKKQMQQQSPYVILADAGDAIQGAPIGTLSEGGYLVDIMNQVGYDFAIPGNHEFDYGMNRFLELSKKMNCGYYSCNFMDLRTGNTVFAPYKMFTFGDVKVALVGASTPESFTKSTPSYFQNANGTYIYMDSVRMRAARACTRKFSLRWMRQERMEQLTSFWSAILVRMEQRSAGHPMR